jgi:hypothetical protein
MVAILFAIVPLISAQEPAAPAPEAKRALRIGLGAIEAHDVDPLLATVLEDSLLTELRKMARSSVIGMKEIKEMLDLEAEKQSLGCAADAASCLAEVADAIGVDVLVLGSVAVVGGETVVGLRRLEQASASAHSVTKRVPLGDGEEVLALVGPLVAELFPELPLRPGQTRGVSPEAARRLNPPPLPWPVPIALGAAAGVGVIATAVSGALWWTAQSRYRTLANTKGAAVSGDDLNAAGAQATATEPVLWIALGATAALGIATAVSVPFTDFRGGGDADE